MEYGPKIGVDSVYVAPLTEGSDTLTGTPAWGTPVRLSGAAMVTGNPNGTISTDWGDNGPFFTTNTRGNLQAQVELIDVDPTVLAAILGQTKANGIVQEGALDQAPYYALGFRVWIGGIEDSEKIYEYFWYPKGKFTIPTQGATTKKDTISPEHTTLDAEFVKLVNNDAMCTHARTNDPDVAAATITNWFNSPVYSTTFDAGAVSVVIAKATTNVSFTFSKAGGVNLKIAEASFLVGNTVLVFDDGTSVSGTVAWADNDGAHTSVVATFTPSSAFGTSSVDVTVTSGVKDSNGVGCTPATVDLTYP